MPTPLRPDARVAYTRSALTSALLDQLKERPLSGLSVSELCKAAGVSRPTFYQHFKSLDDVLAAAVEDRLEAIKLAADKARPDPSSVPAVLARFLDALWRERRLYRAAVQSNSQLGSSRHVMETWLHQTLSSYFRSAANGRSSDDFDQRTAFAAGGIITVVAQLLNTRGVTRPDFAAVGASLWASVERAILG